MRATPFSARVETEVGASAGMSIGSEDFFVNSLLNEIVVNPGTKSPSAPAVRTHARVQQAEPTAFHHAGLKVPERTSRTLALMKKGTLAAFEALRELELHFHTTPASWVQSLLIEASCELQAP